MAKKLFKLIIDRDELEKNKTPKNRYLDVST